MNPLERRSTFALSSIFALRMLGLFMIIPVFSVVGQSYQYATPALIGLAVGVYGLSQAILQIPFSLWADRFSRKPLIVSAVTATITTGKTNRIPNTAIKIPTVKKIIFQK